MAAGNDPRFTIAHAWLQVTPSVRPCSFMAMRIQQGGNFQFNKLIIYDQLQVYSIMLFNFMLSP
jgi:hypothetical protein